MQQQKSIIEVLQKEYSLLSEKSNTQHKLASSNELKLKTLKSEYNKKMNQIYDDDAKGSIDNKAPKKLPKMKEELDLLSKQVIIERREAVRLRESEITNRKHIESIQKEFDLFCEKIKKLEQQFKKEQDGDTSESDIYRIENRKNIKECWMCDGLCTCED
mgnify:FL=1